MLSAVALHNYVLPLDVYADQFVAPIDALLVVNYLNDPRTHDPTQGRYYDTNLDPIQEYRLEFGSDFSNRTYQLAVLNPDELPELEVTGPRQLQLQNEFSAFQLALDPGELVEIEVQFPDDRSTFELRNSNGTPIPGWLEDGKFKFLASSTRMANIFSFNSDPLKRPFSISIAKRKLN